MKLNDYNLPNWDAKVIETRVPYDNFQVLLLKINIKKEPPVKGEKNIVAVDKDDNVLWVVDLPSDSLYASYQSVMLNDGKLQAMSGSWFCEIDPNTGKIIKENFVK